MTITSVALCGANPAGAEPTTQRNFEQTIGADESTVSDRAVLSAGHVDLGPRFVDGQWRIQVRDDSVAPAVWRDLADAALRVVDAAVVAAPSSADYAFLDAEAGQPLYVVPQTQNPNAVWLGWNTQDPEVLQRVARGATLSLHGVEGPAPFNLFLQGGDFGAPQHLWSSDGSPVPDVFIDVNTHTHANWVFGAPGVYSLDLELSATLIDGLSVSDRQTLRFAVGDATPDAAVWDAGPPQPRPSATAGAQPTGGPSTTAAGSVGADADVSDDGGGTPLGPLVGIGAGVLALIVAALLVVGRGRRARRLAGPRSTESPRA